MQYYDLKIVDDPTPAQAAAVDEISTKATKTFAEVDGGAKPTLRFRVVGLNTGGPDRMIADVDLGVASLPIDLGTWAFAIANRDRAVECVTARLQEVLARRDEILAHLADLRSQIQAVLAKLAGPVDLVDLRYWPIEGSERFVKDELRLELQVEQFGIDPQTLELRRMKEAYHGYGIQELTGCIRRDVDLQRRMSELRQLLDQAEVTPSPDRTSQVQLAEGKILPNVMAERIIRNARQADASVDS